MSAPKINCAMKIWNYIGEFFLFRWLSGKYQHARKIDEKNGMSRDYHGYSSESWGGNKYDRDDRTDSDFHEEEDDYDMMDDF